MEIKLDFYIVIRAQKSAFQQHKLKQPDDNM